MAPNRAFSAALVGERQRAALEAQIDVLVDHDDVDLLLSDTGGYAIVQHAIEEAVTGKTISLIRDPSSIDGPALLHEAARRAVLRGSCRIGIDIGVGDHETAEAARRADIVPEYHRIVCRLDDAPAAVETEASVAAAAAEDRMFLVALSTECVPFMFCADRKDDIAQVRQRFFDVYAGLDLVHDEALRVWVARVDHEPAGAVLIRPEAGRAADDGAEAYIYDISVLPAHWGGRVAVALIDRAIQEMRARGIKYLTGDISVDNTRVQGLAQRYRFHAEHTRHFRRLGDLPRND